MIPSARKTIVLKVANCSGSVANDVRASLLERHFNQLWHIVRRVNKRHVQHSTVVADKFRMLLGGIDEIFVGNLLGPIYDFGFAPWPSDRWSCTHNDLVFAVKRMKCHVLSQVRIVGR